MLAYARGIDPAIPRRILSTNTPIGIAPTGTMAANGAVTFGTALAKTYGPTGTSAPAGIWMYFKAGAVYAGSAAGFYWCVMTSTTLGTVYNTTFNPALGLPAKPVSTVAVVDAGPGAFTGETTIQLCGTKNIPAGAFREGGQLRVNFEATYHIASGTKTLTIALGGQSIIATNRTTTGGHDNYSLRVRSADGLAGWTAYALSESSVTSTQGHTLRNQDMTAAMDLTFSLTTDTATQIAIWESLEAIM